MAKKPTKAAEPAVAATAVTPKSTLQLIADATASAQGYTNEIAASELATLGDLVEVNGNPEYAKNNDPAFPAVRVSAKGLEKLAAEASPTGGAFPSNPFAAAQAAAPAAAPAVASTEVPAATAAVYEIKEFTLPPAKRAGAQFGARPEKFPFSKLEKVGQGFFIPNGADNDNDPVAKYGSTVASASMRYASDDTSQPMVKKRKGEGMVYPKKYERKFVIRAVTAEQAKAAGYPAVAGAVVGRVI